MPILGQLIIRLIGVNIEVYRSWINLLFLLLFNYIHSIANHNINAVYEITTTHDEHDIRSVLQERL